MGACFSKWKEVAMSVVPIALLVLLLHRTICPVEGELILRFFMGTAWIILGLGLFLFGIELAVTPLGEKMGEGVARMGRLSVGLFGFFLGFLITMAEPDLLILSQEVSQSMGGMLNPWLIVTMVSLGVGVMVAVGLYRILLEKSLSLFFIIFYGMIALLSMFSSDRLFPVAFDSSGATTGAMTTPFILALGLGVAKLKGSTRGEKECFGLVGLASVGPILSVLLLGLFVSPKGTEAAAVEVSSGVFSVFLKVGIQVLGETLLSLSPLVLLLAYSHWKLFRFPKRSLRRMVAGLIYTFIGLLLFLTGVQAGFMDLARTMGEVLGSGNYRSLLPLLGFILGMVVVLCEPAVYVLADQVEEVTAGSIPRRWILLAFSFGVALAVSLSLVRMISSHLRLWMFLLPGFGISLWLSRKVDPLFVGIAFDSGGVSSGPMTATFILALAQGVAMTAGGAEGDSSGFGVIAMVAMVPILTMHLLGMLYKIKLSKGKGETESRWFS